MTTLSDDSCYQIPENLQGCKMKKDMIGVYSLFAGAAQEQEFHKTSNE